MIDSVLSLAAGGATGLVGTALSYATRHLGARQAHHQEVELRQLDLQIAEVEAQAAERQTALETDARRLETDTRRQEAEWEAMRASYQEAARRWSRPGDSGWMVLVDVVRGLTRPALTWASLVGLGWIWWSLPVEAAASERVVDTIIYLASTCVLWWFGARGIDKGLRR